MTDISERLRDGEKRFLKWAHKEQYSGPSVLSIPRHPDNIDALLDEAAAHIDAQDAKIKALVEALEPFSIIAGEMFARNWNTDQPPVIALDNPEGGNRVTVSDFFQARAALSAAKETT